MLKLNCGNSGPPIAGSSLSRALDESRREVSDEIAILRVASFGCMVLCWAGREGMEVG